MVAINSYPTEYATILVQINYKNGNTGFFSAKNEQDILVYSNSVVNGKKLNLTESNVVAIFYCKPKLKP